MPDISLFAAHTWHLPNHIDLIIEFDTNDSPNDGAMEHSHPFPSQIHQANGYATRLPLPNTLQTPSSQTPQATESSATS
jgi:hypothetical protein